MITRLKLKPGQKGTKALVEKYSEDLVCVRYRYDEASRTRIKTVELIVERKQLSPSVKKKTDETLVPVQIAYGATKLGKMARSAGGIWDPDVKLWYIQVRQDQGYGTRAAYNIRYLNEVHEKANASDIICLRGI